MDVEDRLDRIESREGIRQLISRYSVLIDARDIEGVTNLFVDDVRVTRTERGRPAMREMLEELLSRFTTSVHFVGATQTLEFTDSDHAEGVVYCRAEHEYGDQWVVMAIQYWDRYERRDGDWLFTGRKIHSWYAVDVLERPNGPDKTRWTVSAPAVIPQVYDTWNQFWARHEIPTGA
jgi:ketosteroid isomerase-like protein